MHKFRDNLAAKQAQTADALAVCRRVMEYYIHNGDFRNNWSAWRYRAANKNRYSLTDEHEAIWRAFGRAQQTRFLTTFCVE